VLELWEPDPEPFDFAPEDSVVDDFDAAAAEPDPLTAFENPLLVDPVADDDSSDRSASFARDDRPLPVTARFTPSVTSVPRSPMRSAA